MSVATGGVERVGGIRLVKAQALGNDFLLAVSGGPSAADAPEMARRVCDRHYGVGADGLILVEPVSDGAHTRLWNADGSPSEVSGNGVRCVAAWLVHERGLEAGATVLVGTAAGPKSLTLLLREGRRFVFRAGMGRPEDLRQVRLDAGGESVTVAVLRVGNPQCVLFGPVTADRLHRLGAALAVHPFFPEGTNVELATLEAPDRVRILIWERGVGPTRASGTGACAAAIAAAAFGGAERRVDVVSPGGVQRVEWTTDEVFLTGWAELTADVAFWLS